MRKSLIFLPSLLLLVASSSMAMSLGRHSGATLIGRPLDITVQAVLEAQDDVSSLCLDADVFYADNRLEKSRVRVTLEKSASSPTQAVIRIRSAVLVDEPVVTIYLRAGCQLKIERRYVTLAELVSEAVPDKNVLVPMPPESLSAAPDKPAVLPSATDAIARAEAAAPKANRSGKRSRSGASAAEAQVSLSNAAPGDAASKPKAPRASTAARASKAAASSKARLKLEPLDLVIDRDPQLRASSELLSIPAANPQERAAASALWRALSAQPQDILRDTEKLQSLESSVRGLKAQSQKTLLSIDDLNLKLQQSQTERYANVLVYALVALLLAAMVGLVFLWRQRQTRYRDAAGDKPWWGKNQSDEAYEDQQEAWVDSLPSHQRVKPSVNRLAPIPKSILVGVDVDFDLDQGGGKPSRTGFPAAAEFVDSAPFSIKNSSDFGLSMSPSRAVKAEELFDVQQQADFFVSIGQHEQAIEVLRSYITENLETSPLVYLDLFNLYHQLKLTAEYDALRGTFNQRFNTELPAFELYTNKNSGLESYQLALSRIEALWPSPKVLELIEESLFRRPDIKAEAFNLEAYRELLMLYAVAKEIITPLSSADLAAKKFDLPDRPVDSISLRPMTFMATSIQPLSASMDEAQKADQNVPAKPLIDSVVPPASLRLGLDIDLSDEAALHDKANLDSASDAEFFAKFDVSKSGLASAPVAESTADTDNLIDFDIFDEQPELIKPKRPAA